MARIFLILTLLLSVISRPAAAQNTPKDCKKPPKILAQPSFSKEDQKKWKGKSVQGRIAIVISEDGDVTQAQVVNASPKGVEEALVDAAKRAKFQPRKGCGELKSDIFFNFQ